MPAANRKKLLYTCAIFIMALLLCALARLSGTLAEWYAQKIFPLFPHTLGRLFSPLPFSVAELLLLALALAALALLIIIICALPRAAGRARLKILLPRLGQNLLLLAACLLLLFMLTCGINYSRASIAVHMGLETRPSTAQELRQLYDTLAQQATQLAQQTQRNSANQLLLPRADLHSQARASMRQLSQLYGGLAGYAPNPKPLLLSEGMSWLHLNGIYSPFTMEANYNSRMPMLAQPFAVCHELAHLNGYAREDEANFIAYLACEQSANTNFRYSGTFQALIYVLNALYTVIPAQEYSRLYEQLPAQTRLDLQQNAAYWQSYEGQAAQLSEQVNNTYLKANSQADGVQSYGRMVDLLLAYYIKR